MNTALNAFVVAALWICGATSVVAQEAPTRTLPPPPAPALIHGYVYFDPGSDQPVSDRGDIVQAVVSRFSHATWPDLFLVVGKTDAAGDAVYNMDLSRRRAIYVAERLVALGAVADSIRVWACGENRLNRPTADGVAEPLNRMVNFEWLYNSTEPLTPPDVCEVVAFPTR